MLALISFSVVCVTPKMGQQFANSPVVAQQDVYSSLTTYTDDDGRNPQVGGAKIVINAPDKAEIGELIRFDVSASKAESFKWILVPKSVDFEVYNGGRRAIFSVRKAGKYMFIVACAHEGTVDVMTHTVIVSNPGPNPNDYPDVPRPGSEAKIIKWISYWCALTARPQDEAIKLAESFEGVAATISAGVNTTPEDIIKATSESNRQALGESLEAWKPFLLSLQNEFKNRASVGTLVSPEQHAKMWYKVASGLRAYAGLFEVGQ